jgi:type II secretory pathway component PulL
MHDRVIKQAVAAIAAMRELPSSGMVARCVSAASASGLDCQDWTYAALEELVRVIIKEMREPTTEMLKGGTLAYGTAGQGFLTGAWRAMIDAALAD